jgi:hypothetical protein
VADLTPEDQISRMNDIAKDIGDTLDAQLRTARDRLIDFGVVFREIIDTSDDLPKNIVKVRDLFNLITKDGRVLNKVYERTHKIVGRDLANDWAGIVRQLEKKLKLTGQDLANTQEYAEAHANFQKYTEALNQELEEHFSIWSRTVKVQQMSLAKLGNITEQLNKLEHNIRNPRQAVEGMLMDVGSLPNKLLQAQQAAGGFGKMLKEGLLATGTKLKSVFAAMFSVGGVIAIGLTAIIGLVTVLYKAFRTQWDYMDKKIMPLSAAFNKELGNMGGAMSQLRSRAAATGNQFEMLGLSWQDGANAVLKLGAAMNDIAPTQEATSLGLKLSEYVGLGAENAGKLLNAFIKTGDSIKNLNNVMGGAISLSKEYGVPVNQIRKDLGENINLIHRFGTANIKELSISTAKVLQYGMRMKDVDAVFGKSMNTFDKTSDVAAKLNSVFGTSINSFELMLEENPERRMEMLRKQLDATGKSWDKLGKFEKDVITNTLGISEEQAALALTSGKARKEVERMAKEKAKDIKINQEWERGILNLKSSLVEIGPKLDMFLRKISDIVAKLFGFEGGGDAVKSGADAIGKMMDDINKNMDRYARQFFASPGGKLIAWMFDLDTEFLKKGVSGSDLSSMVDTKMKDFKTELAEIDQVVKEAKPWALNPDWAPTMRENLVRRAQEDVAASLGFDDWETAMAASKMHDQGTVKENIKAGDATSKILKQMQERGSSAAQIEAARKALEAVPQDVNVNLYIDSQKMGEVTVKGSRR